MEENNTTDEYLFTHDYGMGGIWVYVTAKNPYDVMKIYKKLTWVRTKPEWLQNDEKHGVSKVKSYNISEMPEVYDSLK